jgi:peptidyl-prolyl cis-trans isomerase C
MNKITRLAAALAISALSLPVLAESVAVVNGTAIDKSELDITVRQIVQSSGGKVQDTPALREDIKERLIGRVLLIQEATRRGLDKNAAFTDRLQRLKGDLLMDALEADEVKSHPVTDAQIKSTYDSWAAQLKGSKEIRVRQIVVDSEAEATKLIAQLKKSGNFEALAKARSKDPAAKQTGGDMGWANAATQLPPQLADALKNLNKGQVSTQPLRSNAGWHIFKVEDTRPATVPSFEQVKPQIARDLQQRELAKMQQDLRAKAKIQ